MSCESSPGAAGAESMLQRTSYVIIQEADRPRRPRLKRLKWTIPVTRCCRFWLKSSFFWVEVAIADVTAPEKIRVVILAVCNALHAMVTACSVAGDTAFAEVCCSLVQILVRNCEDRRNVFRLLLLHTI